MAKVYISSTVADLREERKAVMNWLVQAGHQPVHSYRPDSETVRESCLNDIDGCSLYVVILGHRYGFQPRARNPKKLSITHLEFRRAGRKGLPRIALLRMSIPDVALSDVGDADKLPLALAFRQEVAEAVRVAEFRNESELLAGLSAGILAPIEKRAEEIAAKYARMHEDDRAEIAALRKELEEQRQAAVMRTVAAAAQPDASPKAVAAAKALEAGDTRPAEALLKRAETKQIRAVGVNKTEQRRKAAALARERGALAMGRDVRAALAAFEQAAKYEPKDIWTHYYLGDLYLAAGDLNAAMQSFRRGGKRAAALVKRDPDNTQWQRDLSVSHNKIGDVLVAQGDGPAALAAYRKALKIAEALAKRDLANTEWQRDLSASQDRIGNVLVAQGDGPAALEEYQKALAIRKALAKRDPDNTQWQRDLSVSHNKIGDVLAAQGDGPAALAEYRKAFAIREALAKRDPANTEWQRDLSVSHSKIGDVSVAQDDGPAALAAYRKALVIVEALAKRDPANAQWQVDVAVPCWKIGSLECAGDRDARIEYLVRGRDILKRLKRAGRLHPNQDSIAAFDRKIDKLRGDGQ